MWQDKRAKDRVTGATLRAGEEKEPGRSRDRECMELLYSGRQPRPCQEGVEWKSNSGD